ncbi:MAG TPA: hypothetical protein PLH03_08305 [Methylophilaceae bacterium]|nr:hypothetical protein [Methylophilaceae bacterium]
MMLVFLALALAALPLMLLSKSFAKLAVVSAYAGVAHLLLLGLVLLLVWYGMRYEAISRVWRRKNR